MDTPKFPNKEKILHPEDRMVDVAYSILEDNFKVLLSNLDGVKEGIDPEYLHEMRVASRRIRATLKTFSGFLLIKDVKTLRADFSWFGRGIGSVRDMDVDIANLDSYLKTLSDEERKIINPYKESLIAKRRDSRSLMLSTLNSEKCKQLFRDFEIFLRTRPHRLRGVRSPFDRVFLAVPHIVMKNIEKVLKIGKIAIKTLDADQLHLLRIRCKRLRYFLEPFFSLYGRGLKKFVQRLVELQDILGAHQDAVVAIKKIRASSSRMRGRESEIASLLLALQNLSSYHEKRADEAKEKFKKLYLKLSHSRTLREIENSLKRMVERKKTESP